MKDWGLLLAAGESVRMGQAKALLPWQGRPLLQFQMTSLLEASVAGVVVVLGHEAEKLRSLLKNCPQAQVVVNADYKLGRSSSIKVGVRQVPLEAGSLLILGVDQPRPSHILKALLETHRRAGSAITIPLYKDRRGHPPIFASALFPELLAISEEKQGLREVLVRHRAQVQEVEVDSEAVLLDLNTPQEYERALKLFPKR
ncbi:MAG: nucleotidyltransferase family protein [Chloroflexi bacterium]|nr:nucleotidyltransferase family protein [Chloroflexota bacterium]